MLAGFVVLTLAGKLGDPGRGEALLTRSHRDLTYLCAVGVNCGRFSLLKIERRPFFFFRGGGG